MTKGGGAVRASYERSKVDARQRRRAQTLAGQDIGPIPPVADPDRRAHAEEHLRTWAKTYFPNAFYLPWSADHVKVTDVMHRVVCDGGLCPIAMPRGGGKTSLCVAAALYAVFTGRHNFVGLIGANGPLTAQLMQDVQAELDSNPLLLADYPEVCFPIHALEGESRRCIGQRVDGKRTRIEWKQKVVVLPYVEGSPASGAIIKAASLMGAIRGMRHKRADGFTARPTLAIPDDPQTEESAASELQCSTRERILTRAVKFMPPPDRAITILMPCTVMREGDLADRMLSPALHPTWAPVRTKMLYAMPKDMALWERYQEIRAAGGDDSGAVGGAQARATAFYRENRVEMDAGAEVAWPERHEPHQLSGLQYAMDLYLEDPAGFASECQNEPQEEKAVGEIELMSVEEIMARVNRLPEGRVPADAQHLTAFVDVQDLALYWVVCGWSADFTGYVLAYGIYPEQPRRQVSYRDVAKGKTLRRVHQGKGPQGAIFEGLSELTKQIIEREWSGDDGRAHRVGLCGVDQGHETDTVHRFCRHSPHATVLMPFRGRGIKAANIPMSEYARKPGDRHGFHWYMPPVSGGRVLRHVEVDVNFWKSFLHDRLRTSLGDPGSLTFYGSRPADHRMIAEQLRAERPTKTAGQGRELVEWTLPPGKPDNHLPDCLVGCAAAASILGCRPPGLPAEETRERGPRRSLRERQDAKRRERNAR